MKQIFIFLLIYLCAVCPSCADGVQGRYAAHSAMATGRWVRVRTDAEGVYQVSHATLRSMGFSDPKRVRLYGTVHEVLPESGLEDLDDDMVEIPLCRMEGKVLFFAQGTTRWTLTEASERQAAFTHSNNPYALSTTYFFAQLPDSVSGAPKEFPAYAYNVVPSARTVRTTAAHEVVERDAYSFINTGRTFFDSDDYANQPSHRYTLALPDAAAGSTARVTVQFCAAGNAASTLTVLSSDSTLGTLSFSPLTDYIYGRLSERTFSVPAQPSTAITLRHNRAQGIAGRLDYIRASYVRQLRLPAAQGWTELRPTGDGDQVLEIAGGAADTQFWRVTRAAAAEEVQGTYDAGTSTWRLPFSPQTAADGGWKAERIVAVKPSAAFPTPVVLGAVPNQDLHALRDIDLVIVVPTSGRYVGEAERLARAHERDDGTRWVVVREQDVFNEFSGGTPDATALRRLMKMLYDTASSPADRPKNLLLFGPCLWDNRLVTPGLGRLDKDDYLLTYQSDNALSHTQSYVLEEYFTLTDDRAGASVLRAKPRIGVGRIPCTSVSEARAVVDKTIAYIGSPQPGAWKNTVALLADDGNENQHMRDADSIYAQTARLCPDLRLRRIYWDSYARTTGGTGYAYPDAFKDVNALVDEGALIINYWGHGAAYCLSHEQVLRIQHFADWSSPRLPLWITAACDVSPFDMHTDNIGTTALLNPRGGALAMLSTARTVYSTENRLLCQRFMRRVLERDGSGRPATLGEALARAKCDYIDTYNYTTANINKAHFVLLGDPALRLALPTERVVVDRLEGAGADGRVAAGGVLTLHGHVETADGQTDRAFSGVVRPIVQDNEERVVCKNNAGDDVAPYAYTDRPHTLYTSADSVRGGQFSVSFPIPLDNNYSGQAGLITLYAEADTARQTAHGKYAGFSISGTGTALTTDTLGPDITLLINESECRDLMTVNPTPLLTATLSDADGLNMTGSGIGHDITLDIDNDATTTYSLNSRFTPTLGDYRSGTVAFSIPELPDGEHTLTLRAFDIFNNPSQRTVRIAVNAKARPTISHLTVNTPVRSAAVFTIVNDRPQSPLTVRLDVYDTRGRHLWATRESTTSAQSTYVYTWDLYASGRPLPPGVYIVRAAIASAGSPECDEAVKFVVTAQ